MDPLVANGVFKFCCTFHKQCIHGTRWLQTVSSKSAVTFHMQFILGTRWLLTVKICCYFSQAVYPWTRWLLVVANGVFKICCTFHMQLIHGPVGRTCWIRWLLMVVFKNLLLFSQTINRWNPLRLLTVSSKLLLRSQSINCRWVHTVAATFTIN